MTHTYTHSDDKAMPLASITGYSMQNKEDNAETNSLASFPISDSGIFFSMESNVSEKYGCASDDLNKDEQENASTNKRASFTAMSVETGMLSGIKSEVMESVAMLSLHTNNQDENGAEGENLPSHPPFSCVHEGSSTNIYRLNDPPNKFGGRTNAIAIKVLSDQFPDEAQLARLENERNVSMRLSGRCAAVRPVLSSDLSSKIESMLGMEGNGSRLLYLEWVPGQTLRDWVRVQEKEMSSNVPPDKTVQKKSRHESSLRMAWQIAHSLSEIHEAGDVTLNNISSENIIVSSSPNDKGDYSVHMIGLGSASHNEEPQQKAVGIQKDLRSLGEVFYELFSGQSPRMDNNSDNLDEKIDDGGDQIKPFHSLRELRSALFISLVPSQLAAFILELMGAFELTFAAVSNLDTSNQNYYKSVREVNDGLRKMILEPDAFPLNSTTKQQSSEVVGSLNFSTEHLYGRKEQQAALIGAYERVILTGGACEVVVVSGFSGTGKTAFVEQTVRQLITKNGGNFLHVKFDQLCQAKPLASIIASFEELCNNILVPGDGYSSQLISTLEKMMGIEGLSMLAELIPSFGNIIGNKVARHSISIGSLMTENRLSFIFQSLLKAITGPEKPMIMFLDDLQWADKASLNLFRSLVIGSVNKSLLFVESYRVNEIDPSNHPFSNHLIDLKSTARVTEINISNLKISDVNELLSDYMCESPAVTEPLSSIIYRKTGGNVLLAIQLMKSLWDEGLLWFSFYKKRWQWCNDAINSKEVPEDAAGLIAQKILYFPPNSQLVLKKMACFGSQCEKSILCLIGGGWVDNGIVDAKDTSNMFCYIDIAIHEGIIDDVGTKYKFAHDQIQLAVYSLIPQSERSSWHLQIAQQMIRAFTSEEMEKMLFVVVDQLNRGKASITKEAQLIELAELNYRAGKRAESSCMFSSAASYFEEGISLLGKSFWNDHYGLWLRLYTSYAESEFRTGNFEKMTDALQCVIDHARSFGDELPSYRILIFSLGAQKKLQEAIEMGLGVLEEAGEHFPRDPDASVTQAEVTKTKRMLDGKTVDTLMSKVMDDKQMLNLMEILGSLCLYAVYAKPAFFPLFGCRMVQLSLYHGVCASTVYGFAAYSVILCGNFNDLNSGNRNGKLSLDMMEKMKAWHQRCRVYPILYSFVFPQTEDLHLCQKQVLSAYHESIKVGDTEFAMVNGGLCSTIFFQGGMKLESVLKFLSEIEKKSIEYKQESPHQLVLPMKQAILNLMGRSENLAILEGEVISFRQYLSTAEEKQNVQVSCRLYLYQMRLAYLFNEIELASQMMEKSGYVGNILLGKFECCELIFYDGLIAFCKARQTSKDSWITLGKESIKKLQKWAHNAPCNCEHKLCLLEAEQYFNLGSGNRAIEKYESAILLSGENGFIQDQALSYERAAMYYLENGDFSRSSYYYGQAHDKYVEWGAMGKADHMCRHSPF